MGDVALLPSDLVVLIHSASTVSFDPPIDEAFKTNVGGAVGLYEALLQTGSDPHVVHVSTAYVGGIRKGTTVEASLQHSVNWRVEMDAAVAARAQVEASSRRPEVLRVARPAENDLYSPEEIFHAPETFTNRMRASSLSLFQVSPLGVATA